MRKFEAVIFDMDGLLLDTERIALSAFHETCKRFGLENQTDLFMQCIGTNSQRAEAVLKDGLKGKPNHTEFLSAWDATYLQRTCNTVIPLKNGAKELLAHLADMNLPIAVATSTKSNRAMQKLRDAGILPNFKAIVGGDQVKNSKPHPDIYLKAADVLGVVPEKCLALEDSDNGVRSALSAGMTVIQVPDLVEPTAVLRSLGHTIMDSLHDVRRREFEVTNRATWIGMR